MAEDRGPFAGYAAGRLLRLLDEANVCEFSLAVPAPLSLITGKLTTQAAFVFHRDVRLWLIPAARLVVYSEAGNDRDLNRWMQHLNSNYREGGVANEAETGKIFH